jgi:predicted LPLAT superfamily acyltransferase
LAHRETGGTFGMRATLLVARALGPVGVRIFLAPAVVWFWVTRGAARRASRAYLARVLPCVRPWHTLAHFWTFVCALVDRVFFLRGELRGYTVQRRGSELLERQVASGRGALLLGAHLGSFEAMRAVSRFRGLDIHVLVHFANAARLTAVLARVAPEFLERVIEIDPGDPTFVLRVQERIEAGSLVAVLGDRVGLGERSVAVDFLGSPAHFPTGPFALAAVLGCPVYLVFGLLDGGRRYSLSCELFRERVELPRRRRQEAVRECVEAWARALETRCRSHPDNWFNFYDFWYESGEHPT